MIHVLATVELQPGTREKFLREFSRVRSDVVAEEGCLEYVAAVDIASGLGVQPPLREDIVEIVEKWTSLEALKRHLASSHMGVYRVRVKDFVAKATLKVLEGVD